MIHVTIQQLSSYLDEQLAGGSADLVRQHLAECSECESKLGALARMDAALARALSHDPPEDVLRRIEREVAAALGPDRKGNGAEPLNAAPTRAARSVRAVWANASAGVGPSSRAVPNGVPAASSGTARQKTMVDAIPSTAWAPKTSRPGVHAAGAPSPVPRRSKGSAAGTWAVVFSLAIIAGSAGVMVSHSGSVQGWLDSLVSNPNFSTQRPSAPRDVEQIAAPSDTTTVESIDAAAGTSADSATASPNPPGVAPPPRVARHQDSEVQDDSEWSSEAFTEEAAPQTMRADEMMATSGGAPALLHPNPEQFDAAAQRWERILEGTSGQEQVSIRGRIADARYRAWEAGPTPQRADAATSALRSYLLFAPPGVGREEAKARLERLSPR